MIIIVSLVGGDAPTSLSIIKQIFGALFLGGLLYLVFRNKKSLHLPFASKLQESHDLQVFGSFLLCFGLAALTGVLGLSEALGAFIAGILLTKIEGVEWVHDALHSFKTLFVALFFVSIGLLIDVSFFIENLQIVLFLVIITLLINTFINAFILKLLGETWRESFYSGSLLAPVGEFSFILAAVGLSAGVITAYGYQMAIIVIALTLLLSTSWAKLFEKITDVHHPYKNMIQKK